MAQIVICPYSMRSKSAKALADALGTRRVPNSVGLPADTLIINWGSGFSSGGRCTILNKRENVSLAVNKINTLRIISEGGACRTVPFTTNIQVAKDWIREGKEVMCRTIVNGHSGQGIVIAKTLLDLVSAPLYTQFIDKDAEYRIHVFDGKVIDQRRKVPAIDGRRVGDNHICTHTNGYVFNFASAPDDAHAQAISAVKGLGLDFGAVDVITKREVAMEMRTVTKAYVLEVNTAPGLTGSTITAYADAIKQYFA